MSRMILAVMALMVIQSCNKSDDDLANGNIEFKLNGQAFNFNNTSDGNRSASWYKLLPGQAFASSIVHVVTGNDASNPNGVQSNIALHFPADTLKTGMYILDFNSPYIVLNSIKIDTTSYVVWPGDTINFNITSKTNERLSGTFSGQMTKTSGSSFTKVMITDGQVNNLLKR